MKFILFVLLAVCLGSPAAHAYTYASSAATALLNRIAFSYARHGASSLEAEALEREYLALDRTRLSPDDFVEINLAMAAWRKNFGRPLPAFPVSDIAIEPTVLSKYGARGWLDLPGVDIGSYQHRGDEVIYRGVSFRTGDVILTELADEDVGGYTAILEPRGQFSHAAIYLLLRRGPRRIPAVAEAHEGGVRVVPLARFLSDRFTVYSEVYRLRTAPAGFAGRLTAEAEWLLAHATAYDFRARSPRPGRDQFAFTCSSLVTYLLQRGGAHFSLPPSRMNPGVGANLLRLGISITSVIAPNDFARAGFLPVGVVDNDRLPLRIARALVAGTPDLPDTFAGAFSMQQLNRGQLPVLFDLVESLAGHAASASNPLGAPIRMIFGFDGVERVPQGSPGILAFAYISGPATYSSAKNILEGAGGSLEQILEEGPFSLHDLQSAPPAHDLVREANGPWLRWFTPSR